ncbi:MAG TPA: S-formylglutathione hydrolase [Burkholderiaceae bacterium]|nr:S-formylglutathione hydrolase [Burkholderiaceae bacterium]
MTVALDVLSEHKCFDGFQRFYQHDSRVIGLPMRFSVYTPPQAENGPVPVLFYLAGLTCNEETFVTKGGAQAYAAQHGIMLVAPDTSPRGDDVPDDKDAWDFGVAAGFYLDATREPWSKHYKMESYIVDELVSIIRDQFPVDADKIGIFGHSMGGHGALTLALRHQQVFRSVSAFAPICAPTKCPWGHKAFSGYLGDDRKAWEDHDASILMSRAKNPYPRGILIDQGTADQFLAEQLYPEAFEQACEQAGQPLKLRRHEGYDHGYYFISTFMQDHIRFHAERLK